MRSISALMLNGSVGLEMAYAERDWNGGTKKRFCIARGVIDCKNSTWDWCRVSPRAPLDTNQIVVQSIINCICSGHVNGLSAVTLRK